MTEPVKLLLVFVNETDRTNDASLYHAVVHLLHQLGIAGATAHAGVMGFGRHHRVHHKGLFGIADDRPVTIMAADSEAKLRAALPRLRELAGEALTLLVDAEVVTSA